MIMEDIIKYYALDSINEKSRMEFDSPDNYSPES